MYFRNRDYLLFRKLILKWCLYPFQSKEKVFKVPMNALESWLELSSNNVEILCCCMQNVLLIR